MPESRLRPSRRRFAGVAATAAAGGLLTSCNSAEASTVKGACYHDCPDACAWIVTRQNGKLVKIEGDPTHPVTRGKLCPIMDNYLADIVYNPERVLHPMRRVGAKGDARFERVSWDAALQDVAAKLQGIIRDSGPTAILPYSYAGTEGLLNHNGLDRRFFARVGATRLVREVCGSASASGVSATLGTTTGILPGEIVHSRFILIWGANPVFTSPHSWHFIEEAKRAGARVVTIDPQKTATAEKSDWHLQPVPGTDAALALGMMHVIVKEGLHDAEYVNQHCVGFDKLKPRLAEYPPEKVAQITGLRAVDVVELARSYAKTQPSTIRLMIGMEHRANGSMTFRAISCLPGLVGAWRHAGGGLLHFTYELFALNYDAVNRPDLQDKSIRSVNMVQLGQALTRLKPPIRGLVVYSSNPATIAPNQNLVFQGLKREDLFTVVLDHFITDTARYADYVFPAATQVEVLDLMPSWGQHYLALNQPAAPPAGEAVSTPEFFRRLSARMGFQETYLFDSDETMLRQALQSDHPHLKGITYERLLKEGWAPLNVPANRARFANGGFPTPSGKCEFYSEALAKEGVDPLPAYAPIAQNGGTKFPLRLLTSKASRHFLNSSHAGVPRAAEAEGKPLLHIHPADASTRQISDRQMVRVFNDRGSVLVRAHVTDSVRSGVVAMSHGWWASRMPGHSSANALTPDGLSDRGEGGDFHDARVQVAGAV